MLCFHVTVYSCYSKLSVSHFTSPVGHGREEVHSSSLHAALLSSVCHLGLLNAGIRMWDSNQAPCRQVRRTDHVAFGCWGAKWKPFHLLLSRDAPPESPVSWNATLPRSSGSVSTVEEGVVTVGDAEVKLRKSKKKKKRSSMIFITEERERTSTLDCKRVRWTTRQSEEGYNKTRRGKVLCAGGFSRKKRSRWVLCDLCPPLAVKETGVPQWHQLVWVEWRECVVDKCQLQILACHHRWHILYCTQTHLGHSSNLRPERNSSVFLGSSG